MHPRRSHSRRPLPRRRDSSSPSPRWSGSRTYPSTTLPSGEDRFLRRGAVHQGGTDFPWQREANVYILGHRQGYPGTRSHLLFHDLNKLHNGDDVFLVDANGTRYTYEVFRKFVAEPYEVQVTQPIPGKSVVSLQSCTLPEYSKRLIVRAELKDVS